MQTILHRTYVVDQTGVISWYLLVNGSKPGVLSNINQDSAIQGENVYPYSVCVWLCVCVDVFACVHSHA